MNITELIESGGYEVFLKTQNKRKGKLIAASICHHCRLAELAAQKNENTEIILGYYKYAINKAVRAIKNLDISGVAIMRLIQGSLDFMLPFIPEHERDYFRKEIDVSYNGGKDIESKSIGRIKIEFAEKGSLLKFIDSLAAIDTLYRGVEILFSDDVEKIEEMLSNPNIEISKVGNGLQIEVISTNSPITVEVFSIFPEAIKAFLGLAEFIKTDGLAVAEINSKHSLIKERIEVMKMGGLSDEEIANYVRKTLQMPQQALIKELNGNSFELS